MKHTGSTLTGRYPGEDGWRGWNGSGNGMDVEMEWMVGIKLWPMEGAKDGARWHRTREGDDDKKSRWETS